MEGGNSNIKKPLERLLRNRYVSTSSSNGAKKLKLDSSSVAADEDYEGSPRTVSDVKEEDEEETEFGGGSLMSPTSELVRMSAHHAAAAAASASAAHEEESGAGAPTGTPGSSTAANDEIDFDMDEEAARIAEQKTITARGLDVGLLYRQMIAGRDESSDAVKWVDSDASSSMPSVSVADDAATFSVEKTLVLIECVRCLPILWEAAPGAPHKAKRDAWAACALMMRSAASKRTFRVLRDSYMRIVRKTCARGQPMPEKRDWMFFEPLRFLGDVPPAAAAGKYYSESRNVHNDEDTAGDSRPASNAPQENNDEETERPQSHGEQESNIVQLPHVKVELDGGLSLHGNGSALSQGRKSSRRGRCRAKEEGRIFSNLNVDDDDEDEVALEHATTSSSTTESCKDTPIRGSSAERYDRVSTQSLAASTSSLVGSSEDTWARYGSHVSDVLREMRQIDEEAAWEARHAIDALLLAQHRQLRAARDVARSLPELVPVDAEAVLRLRAQLPAVCSPLCDFLAGLTHYVNRELSRVNAAVYSGSPPPTSRVNCTNGATATATITERGTPLTVPILSSLPMKKEKKKDKMQATDALFPYDTSRLAALAPVVVQLPPFHRPVDLVGLARAVHIFVPQPTLPRVCQKFALSVIRAMIPEEERMVFSGCGNSSEHYFIIDDEILKQIVAIFFVAINYDVKSKPPSEAADLHNRIFLAIRDHWTNYLEKTRKDFNREHGKGTAKQMAIEVRQQIASDLSASDLDGLIVSLTGGICGIVNGHDSRKRPHGRDDEREASDE